LDKIIYDGFLLVRIHFKTVFDLHIHLENVSAKVALLWRKISLTVGKKAFSFHRCLSSAQESFSHVVHMLALHELHKYI